MSVGSGGLGTVYSRLPQSTSEIESSEDEVSQHENLIYYRKLATPKKAAVENPENGNLKMGDYQPLGRERSSGENGDVHINGFNNINYNYAHGNVGSMNTHEDEMMILGTVGPSGKMEGEVRHGNLQMLVGHEHPMSVMRRVGFVMSICLCIFTIVAFLWVLPCDWATCPMVREQRHGGTSWEKTLHPLELIGGINVVPSGNKHHNNLMFMVRGEMNFGTPPSQQDQSQTSSTKRDQLVLGDHKASSTPIPPGGGGIITLMGSTGTVVWYKTLGQVPREMDCSIVDLDGDGEKDCLLVGGDDLLYAFKPVTPTNLWFIHNNPADSTFRQVPVDMDFPLILPDLDGDDISELVVSCSLTNKSEHTTKGGSPASLPVIKTHHNYLVVISGKMGTVFGKPFAVTRCLNVTHLDMDKNWVITFTCHSTQGTVSAETMPLKKLYESVKSNSTYTPLNLSKYPEGGASIRQRAGKRSLFSVGGRKLTVENRGHCPKDCAAFVRVSDERVSGSNITLWSDGGENMYALQPATISFSEKPSGGSSSSVVGPVSGFVLKYWHWTLNSNSDTSSSWASQHYGSQSQRMSHPSDAGSAQDMKESWHHEILQDASELDQNHKSSAHTSNSTKTSSVRGAVSNANSSYTTHLLKERIVLVTFNETDILHTVNASQSEIQQLCSTTMVICQPSLDHQEQSMIIADLDDDGSQELVSYLTTYVTEDDDQTLTGAAAGHLQLVSKIRVVRLEAELHKLYEAVTHV